MYLFVGGVVLFVCGGVAGMFVSLCVFPCYTYSIEQLDLPLGHYIYFIYLDILTHSLYLQFRPCLVPVVNEGRTGPLIQLKLLRPTVS